MEFQSLLLIDESQRASSNEGLRALRQLQLGWPVQSNRLNATPDTSAPTFILTEKIFPDDGKEFPRLVTLTHRSERGTDTAVVTAYCKNSGFSEFLPAVSFGIGNAIEKS